MKDSMTAYGQLFTGRKEPMHIGIDVASGPDRGVVVRERWTGDKGERKVGDGPWEPIENLGFHGKRPFVKTDFLDKVLEASTKPMTRSMVEVFEKELKPEYLDKFLEELGK